MLLLIRLDGPRPGATGATTRLAAWFGLEVAPAATQGNAYLGPMVEQGNPLPSWITWQVIGVAIGGAGIGLRGRAFGAVDGARKA